MTWGISDDGYYQPDFEGAPGVPSSRPDSDFGFGLGQNYVWREPYVNPKMLADQVSQAENPTNIWEMIKFAGLIYQRQLETLNLPIAEWDAVGRGAMMPVMQHPSVVSGNVAEARRVDRYGPFNDPRMSQAAIDNFLASAIPQSVQNLNNQTILSGPSTVGFGRPGG